MSHTHETAAKKKKDRPTDPPTNRKSKNARRWHIKIVQNVRRRTAVTSSTVIEYAQAIVFSALLLIDNLVRTLSFSEGSLSRPASFRPHLVRGWLLHLPALEKIERRANARSSVYPISALYGTSANTILSLKKSLGRLSPKKVPKHTPRNGSF